MPPWTWTSIYGLNSRWGGIVWSYDQCCICLKKKKQLKAGSECCRFIGCHGPVLQHDWPEPEYFLCAASFWLADSREEGAAIDHKLRFVFILLLSTVKPDEMSICFFFSLKSTWHTDTDREDFQPVMVHKRQLVEGGKTEIKMLKTFKAPVCQFKSRFWWWGRIPRKKGKSYIIK